VTHELKPGRFPHALRMRPIPNFAGSRVSIQGAPFPRDGVQFLRLEGHRFREFLLLTSGMGRRPPTGVPVSFFRALAYATMCTPPRTNRHPHIALDAGSGAISYTP
jgi:hypothetical protein